MDKVNQVEEHDNSIEKAKSVKENKIKNETLTTELQFELLKQYAWLSSAIIGAVVILVQLKILTFDSSIYIPLVCFGFSILNSLFAQDFIVESLSKGKSIYDISKTVYILRILSIFGLGLGCGLLTKGFI